MSRIGPSRTRARSESRLAPRGRARAEDEPGLGGVVVGAEDQPCGSVWIGPGGDDVLGGAAKEETADQIEAGVLVQVEGGRREQDQQEAHRREHQREQRAGDRQDQVGGDHERVLGVYVGGLEAGAAPRPPQTLGEVLRGAALGVGPRPATLVRAELVDQLPAVGGVQGAGIIGHRPERATCPP